MFSSCASRLCCVCVASASLPVIIADRRPMIRGKFPSLQGCDNYTYHNHKSRPMREIIKSQIPQQQHQPTNQEGGLPAFIISEDEGMPSRK